MNKIKNGDIIKCHYCASHNKITARDIEEFELVGKSVIECNKCGKLFTVHEEFDDGEYIYYV